MTSSHSRFQLIPAAYVLLVDEDGQVLLSYRRGTGYMDEHWAFGAAGHVEAEETVHEAAVREVREELGVEIDAADLEPLTVMHRTGANGQAIDERVDFFFVVRRWEGEPRTQEADKSAGLQWADLDELPEPVVPHEHLVLTRWAAGTLEPVTTFGFGR